MHPSSTQHTHTPLIPTPALIPFTHTRYRVWPWINKVREAKDSCCMLLYYCRHASLCLHCFEAICQTLWKNNLKSFRSAVTLNPSHLPPNTHGLWVKYARYWRTDNRWAVLYMLQLVLLRQVTTRWELCILLHNAHLNRSCSEAQRVNAKVSIEEIWMLSF